MSCVSRNSNSSVCLVTQTVQERYTLSLARFAFELDLRYISGVSLEIVIMLNAFIVVLLAAVLCPSILYASDVALGDSLAYVKSVLGEPHGYVAVGDDEILYYERGKVEFALGVVSGLDLVSEEEALRRKEKRMQAIEEHKIREEKMKLKRHAEGLALLQEKLSEPAFLSSSASVRLAFWQDFIRRYPEVSAHKHYAAALQEREKDLKARAAEQRIAALEDRLEKAEERARKAEETSMRVRTSSRRYRNASSSYPSYRSAKRYSYSKPRMHERKVHSRKRYRHGHHKPAYGHRSHGSFSYKSHAQHRSSYRYPYYRSRRSGTYASCRPYPRRGKLRY